jgi:hypothetical protein
LKPNGERARVQRAEVNKGAPLVAFLAASWNVAHPGVTGTGRSVGNDNNLLDGDRNERAEQHGRAGVLLKGDEASVSVHAEWGLTGTCGPATPWKLRDEGCACWVAHRTSCTRPRVEKSDRVKGRIFGVEVVGVVLGEGLLGTVPCQVGYPGDGDIADRVRIDGVDLGLILNFVSLFGGFSLKVDVIFAGGLKLDLGVGRVGGLGGSDGDGREAVLIGRNSRIA